jgi:hypothetical protein
VTAQLNEKVLRVFDWESICCTSLLNHWVPFQEHLCEARYTSKDCTLSRLAEANLQRCGVWQMSYARSQCLPLFYIMQILCQLMMTHSRQRRRMIASIFEMRRTNASTADRPNPIKTGYVAFGDSFAVAIGTGTTEGSGCRQGEFSYPKQMAATVQNIDFQNYACSGPKPRTLPREAQTARSINGRTRKMPTSPPSPSPSAATT